MASGSAVNLVVSSGPAPSGNDVSLTRLIAPAQITARVGADALRISVRAIATSTAGEVDATVTLTAAPGSGVRVSLRAASIRKEIEGDEEETFRFPPESPALRQEPGR